MKELVTSDIETREWNKMEKSRAALLVKRPEELSGAL